MVRVALQRPTSAGLSIQMLSSGGEANEGLPPAGLPPRRAPLLIVLLIPLLACLGTATAAQGYGLRGPAPSRALAAEDAPTSVAEGVNATWLQHSCIEAYGAENCISPFTNARRPIVERTGENLMSHWLFTYQYEHCRAVVGKNRMNYVLRKEKKT